MALSADIQQENYDHKIEKSYRNENNLGSRYETSPNTSIRVTERRIANQGGTILSKNIGKAYNENVKSDHQSHIDLCTKTKLSITSIAIEFPIKRVQSKRC